MPISLPDLERKKKLAYAYRILGILGLDDHTYTHLSARSANGRSFYIYPFGMRFEEVTVDDLLKVSLAGNIEEGEEYQYNRTGYIIHGSIYEHRPDINAVFHLHTHAMIATSIVRDGLLPISQWALHFYNRISYHAYESLSLDEEHGEKLVKNLAKNMVMILRNHGAIMCGGTIEEAMFYTYHLEQACKTQCMLLSMDVPYIKIPDAVCKKAVHDLLSFEEKLGERDWKAWVRMVDNYYSTR